MTGGIEPEDGQPTTQLAAHAERLRALHVPGTPVVLPNAWDVTSARVFEDAGFPAIATSSSAVARALGYEDGENIPADEMLSAVARIAGAVTVPVTADIEHGYGLEAGRLVEQLVDTGAVGCNLEDSDPHTSDLIEAGEHCRWLTAVRDAAVATGVPLVLNARVDVHLLEWGEPAGRMEEAIERARAYRAAGADCVYPIGLAKLDDVRQFVDGVDAPVNVVFRPRGPSMEDFAAAGVARISFGGGLHQAMQAGLRALAGRIREGRDPYEAR